MTTTTSSLASSITSSIVSSSSSIASSLSSHITSSLSSVQPTHTTSAPAAATTTPAPPGGGGPQSSPLLFFVALGFGVVFTNLWIIVGVKYCFRYSSRNRNRPHDENGDPIDLGALPRQRRRREKKLMTMEEVNERFPITKYKSWTAARAEQGLSTAGGVNLSASRPASIKNESGTIETSRGSIDDTPRPGTSASTHPSPANEDEQTTGADGLHPNALSQTKTTTSTQGERGEDDDEEAIQMAVPTEMMANPGDSCAICIDTLDDDDDVRGLTCGHAFHASCVDPWLTSRRACCPLCKADYYVPKPRPEGENADLERGLGRRSTNLPAPPISPAYAFLGHRFRRAVTERERQRSQNAHAQPVHAAPRWPILGRRPRSETRTQHLHDSTQPPVGQVAGQQEAREEQQEPSNRRRIPMPAVHMPRMPWRRNNNEAAESTETTVT